MSPQGDHLAPRLLPLRILHVSMCLTLVIYAVVAEVAVLESQEQIEHLPYILGGIALLVAAMVPILRQRTMPERKTGAEPVPGELGPEARSALGRYFTAQVLSWALCEGIAVLGLVCALLLGEPIYYYPFAVASAVLMLLLAPRRAELEAVVRAATPSP